jgi:hypothetical protein
LLPHGSEEEAQWKGAHKIGLGAHGRSVLWAKINATGHTIKRLVIKDTFATDEYRWVTPMYWRGRLSTELAILARLKTQNHPNIHGYHGYRLDMQRWRWRIYNDFCNFGDLYHPVRFHEGIVGEQFLWHVLRSLVDACLVLKNGNGGESMEADHSSGYLRY